MSSGWKTVETKKNRKSKKAAVDSDDSDYEGYNGNNTDYRVSSSNTAAGRLMSDYHKAKAEANKPRQPTRSDMAAAAAAEAEALAKRRAENKASAADKARVKRLEAQAHAKKANDVSTWPTIAEGLAVQSEPFMDHFDNIMDEDPIVSKGGIGALLLYAPSIFEKFLFKTRLLPVEASGDVLLTASVEAQIDTYPEALDTFIYYKSLLPKMPEIKAPTAGNNAQAIQDGLIGLISAVWGAKGLKNPLASKDSGRGGVIAAELTFDQLWSLGLQNIGAIAGLFVNVAKGEAHAPQAVLNFQRIFTVMTNGAIRSEEKDAARIAIARATATMITNGQFAALFPDATDSDTIALLDVVATAVRYVSTNQLGNKAYAGIPWRDACGYGEAIAKTQLPKAKLGTAWSVIGVELLARQNAILAKALVAPLLDALERELSGQMTFSPTDSTVVVVLSTVFSIHGPNVVSALKAHAPRAPRASIVFLAIAKASALFEVPAGLEEAVVAAAKKANAQAPPKITSTVKVDDLPASKRDGGKKGGKKDAAAAAEVPDQEMGSGPGILRVLMSLLMVGAATLLVAYQSNNFSPSAASKAN